jgi:hypothetical protein
VVIKARGKVQGRREDKVSRSDNFDLNIVQQSPLMANTYASPSTPLQVANSPLPGLETDAIAAITFVVKQDAMEITVRHPARLEKFPQLAPRLE